MTRTSDDLTATLDDSRLGSDLRGAPSKPLLALPPNLGSWSGARVACLAEEYGMQPYGCTHSEGGHRRPRASSAYATRAPRRALVIVMWARENCSLLGTRSIRFPYRGRTMTLRRECHGLCHEQSCREYP